VRLRVKSKVGGSREQVYDFDGDEIAVGRDATNDIALPHPAVSAVHLRLSRRGDSVVAIDPGSANGTWIDGARLDPGEEIEVVDGAAIDIADAFVIVVRRESPAEARPTSSRRTAQLARELVADLLSAQPSHEAATGPELIGVAGVAAGVRHALPPVGDAGSARLVIGRGRTCGLLLLDPDLSREHAAIHRDWDGVSILDLGSKNGVSVDGQRLSEGATRSLADGSRIELGDCILELADPSARYLEQLRALVGDVSGERASQIIEAAAAPSAPRVTVDGRADRDESTVAPESPGADERAGSPDGSWAGQPAAGPGEASMAGTPRLSEPEPPARPSLVPAIVIAAVVAVALVGLILLFAL